MLPEQEYNPRRRDLLITPEMGARIEGREMQDRSDSNFAVIEWLKRVHSNYPPIKKKD